MSEAFFPLDQRLSLSPHVWTPELIGMALRLGVEIPSCRRAAEAFEMLLKVPLSKSALHRLLQAYGQRLADQEQAKAARLNTPGGFEAEMSDWATQAEPDAKTMAVSMDGVMVHVRQEGWKEVKTVAISAVETEEAEETEEETPQVHLEQHSYRAGLMDVKEFGRHQWVEACRRGLEKARQVVSVNDGAAWIWGLVKTCYAPCGEVLDWWHAVERLWVIGRTVMEDEDEALVGVWVDRLKRLLWRGELRELLREVRRKWPRGRGLPKEMRQAVGYLYHNRRRMAYQSYRERGWPTGSGTVESACKTVVQQRCCQSGMRWSREGLEAMLALRCALLSDRWQEMMALI